MANDERLSDLENNDVGDNLTMNKTNSDGGVDPFRVDLMIHLRIDFTHLQT